MRTRTKAILIALASATLIAAAASARHASPRVPPGTNTVEITAREYGYAGPDTIPAGLDGARPGERGIRLAGVRLVRLDQGVPRRSRDCAWPGGPWPGGRHGQQPQRRGPSTSAASLHGAAARALRECLLFHSQAPTASIASPRVSSRDLSVTGTADSEFSEPRADIEVRLVDYAFQLSAPLAPGRQTLRVHNAGPQTHEVELLRLLPGKTLPDWDRWVRGGMKGEAPAVLIGGIVGLAPGRHAYFITRIEPGRHVLLCYAPDARDGKSHKAHGMVREIEI